ncbi:MAG: hypothetical protein JW910_02205, partial [Anaerolineae bacterium]|nr:hypothetical protein [Anaerolineae bacterium]
FGLWQPIGESTFTDVHCVGPHTFEGTAHFELWVPDGLPDGIYVPFFHVDTGGAPLSQSVPMNAVWYHYDPIPSLPPVVVGEVAAPRIPWTLLTDYPVNGYRGVDALENAGQYAQLMRTVIPPHEVVIPREDARTGRPIAYRLEPGSQWISSTDRRQPNPPFIPLSFPYGELMVAIHKPDGSVDILGPAPLRQSRMQMPSTPGGSPLDHGTGQAADIYHIATLDEIFAYTFDQYGQHVIMLEGMVADVHGNVYPIQNTYEVTVARVLDLDPGQLPTTPYVQGDAFSPGLHIFPPVPADVTIRLLHLPNSDPAQAVEHVIEGRANRYGVFQPAAGTRIIMETPGEFRVDLTARYEAPDGTQWTGSMTWGGVVEGTNARIEAHGRRAMAPLGSSAYMPTWYEVFNLPPELVGIEVDYPYFSGDVHWGNEDRGPGDSIQTAITFRDLTPDQFFYNLLRVTLNSSPENPLETQLSVHEAPLVTTTYSGVNPLIRPDDIHTFSYYYGSSERADVHVREIIASGGVGTPYWRFDDTYGYQIGESAEGDLPGDIKWEFGGAVLRVPDQGINEYAVYSSLWVLLPHGDPVGARITPPFQDATGASINGGPILTLLGEDIDMLFLPKGVRPGDVLEIGDTISFSGHVGPPLDSQVSVTITAPSGATWSRTWHANRIGWLYDPTFDFAAEEVGRWTVDVQVLHDRPYVGNGVVPQSHNTGTVLGTSGQYEFYVVPRDAPRLVITAPAPGFVTWPEGHVEPITIQGIASPGTTAVYYTVHDKGMVMDQGVLTPGADGSFTLVYDARALHEDFPFLSLTAHEGRWEGLSDEVAISFLAVGGDLQANTVTLIGEEVFIGGEE